MLKGKILVPRDYQERIVAYINKMGNDAFTTTDCAAATGVPFSGVQSSLRGRCRRGELEGVLVDGSWLYTKKDDPKITCVSHGLVAELVWATLKDAGSDEELAVREILRRISARCPGQFIDRHSVARDLYVLHLLGYMYPRGERGRYRYRLTEAARQLLERPVISWRTPVPQPQTASQ